MWSSSRTFRTPTWAPPRAPPPAKAMPIFGRRGGACAEAGKENARTSVPAATSAVFRRTRSSRSVRGDRLQILVRNLRPARSRIEGLDLLRLGLRRWSEVPLVNDAAVAGHEGHDAGVAVGRR